ncbi:hypothetical protein H072_7049 [Dactylellina haptotyla CBS 200.50]|uniref:Polynucleotide 5'-hydroxyl-kinase GRC3 n=1 Tax=Dactylellina haptotyla (strain CBS 200.50) TaxID=1284197 RepID=S8A842_DACHA|nr:hypothetical protein H072_7049 [Dactylellina haptotyla CBS 200.50]
MSKRTSDSKVKAPLSALAARRLRQQQQQQITAEPASGTGTPNDDSPVVTPGIEIAPTITRKSVPNSYPIDGQTTAGPSSKGSVAEIPGNQLGEKSDNLPRQLSNFTPTDDNYVYDSQNAEITVKLRRGESLVVQGEFRISVGSGSISICGAIVETSSSISVVAPASQALPVIECASKSKKRKVEKPPNRDGEYDAVFTIKSTRTGLSDLGKVCPRFDKIWKPPLTSTTTKLEGTESFTPILTSLQSTPILTVPPSWQSAITSLSSTKQSPKCIFIVGGKSVGKSTFGRYLLNNIVTSQTPSRTIIYLDVDPGQPSFTPPCALSLHRITRPIVTPSFATFGSTEVLRQHHIGYTSPREDPKYYLRCAADLIQEYRNLVQQLGEEHTLVVNTCGWIKGLGRELLQELVLICEPTDAVGLGDVDGVFAEILPTDKSIKKHLLEGAGSGASGNSNSNGVASGGAGGGGGGGGAQAFSPADLRTLQTVAYFHAVPKGTDADIAFDFDRHLTGMMPIVASYRGANKVIHGITVLDADVTADLAFTAINATVVSINLIKGDDKEHPILRYLEDVYGGDDNAAPFIASNQFDGTSGVLPAEGTEMIGLAIIRGVNEEKGQLQLLTPVSEAELNQRVEDGYKVVLSRGRDEMPVWLMWDWRGRGAEQRRRRGTGANGGGVDKAPYLDFVVGGEVAGKGAKEWKVRRNIMRRGQQRR